MCYVQDISIVQEQAGEIVIKAETIVNRSYRREAEMRMCLMFSNDTMSVGFVPAQRRSSYA